MNRKSSTVLIGSIVIGIAIMLMLYMGLIVTGVIDTRPSTLVVSIGSAQKEFDGTPLTCEEHTIQKGALKKGHTLDVTYGSSQTAVGTSENVASVKIRDALGADVTNHYHLETRPGKLTVTTRSLVLQSGSSQKVYDGTPLTYEYWDLTVGNLPEGYSVNAYFMGTQMIPGTSKNTFVVDIVNENGASASRSFDVTYIYGTLEVTKRPLTVTSHGATMVYNGTPLVYESYTLDGEVLSDHYLDVNFPESITDVGSVNNVIGVRVMALPGATSSSFAGQDVTDFYDINIRVGTLTVEPRPIEISATTCIKHFTGSELPAGQWYLTKGSLVEGHELSADVEAVQNAENTVEFMLKNPQVIDPGAGGAPVTQNYEISLVHGIDRDHLEQLILVSGSKSAPYTGDPLVCEQYVLASGQPAVGHVIVPHFTGSQTEIGVSDNTFTVSVVDEATGEDVTYRYNIAYEYGVLEVYATAPNTGGEISDDGGLDNDTQNADATAARVQASGSGRVYLRWKSYGNYSFREDAGNWGWGESLAYPLASENPLYTVGQALAEDGKLPILYEIELFGNQYLLPNYVASGAQGATNDVVISPYTDVYALYGYNWSYSYADALRYMMAGAEDEQNKAYTAFVYAQYLDVPESTRAALEEFAALHGLAADRLSIIEDVASVVRASATYDLEYPACPDGKDEVVYFLTESQSGVCRHFASAATLLYRTLGIPARYVVGYSTYATGGQWTDVKGADAHAWVEVFITGLGWVRVDPTPAQSSTASDALVLQPIKVMGYYTGIPYVASAENVVVVQGSLQAGHTIAHVEVSGSQTDAGVGTAIIQDVRIEDADGNDVTAQYNLVCKDGVIEVRKPTLTITAASAKKTYDGTALESATYTHAFTNTSLGALYTVQVSVSGSQTEIGQSQNTVGEVVILDVLGRDVTHNFDVRRNHGTLKVYLYELSILSSGATKTYDGTPLSATNLTYDADALAARGHSLEYTMPSITGVGAIYNTPTCRVLDEQGRDVSAQYDLRISAGILRVAAVKLTIVTDSAEKVFDGKALRVDGFAITSGTLVPGQSIVSYQITGSQTNVGVSDAVVTGIVITDVLGQNVTANYQITIVAGALRVLAP